jgi:predicted amidophosphoribosyltransferase
MAVTDERVAYGPTFPAGLPPGFPNCACCPYLSVGPAARCFTCAAGTLRLVGEHACAVCSQLLDENVRCPNELCRDRRRRIGRIQAIAYQSGPLPQVLYDYKFRGARGWAVVLSRLVLGWLAAHAGDRHQISSWPIPAGPDRHSFLHAESVLAAAAGQVEGWPFRQGVIVKSGPTETSADASAHARRTIGRERAGCSWCPTRRAPPGAGSWSSTTSAPPGRQLDAVASCLLDAGGAAQVDGLVLARAQWARTQWPRRR